MKTSEILDLAADKIQEVGWGQGPATWENTGGKGLCLEGGILAAMGVDVLAEPDRSCPAMRAVKDYLGERLTYTPPEGTPYTREPWGWNDEDGRTAEEVIGVLRAAAAVERAKEESLEGQPLREKENSK